MQGQWWLIIISKALFCWSGGGIESGYECCETRSWPRIVDFCCNFRWVLELLIGIFMWGISSISGFASNTKPPCLDLQTPSKKKSRIKNMFYTMFWGCLFQRGRTLPFFCCQRSCFTLTGPCWRWVVWYISSRLWEVRSLPSLGFLVRWQFDGFLVL